MNADIEANVKTDVEMEVGMKQLHDSEFQVVIMKYSNVFKDELSNHLSSMHDFVHEINIDDNESINRSVYQFST